jgi:cell fate (sporulation/competence/biofilm development) regulator YlbF (YheA/YmcA/DUF963 family)
MNMSDTTIPPDLQAAADQLGQSLLQAEPVAGYHQAEARLIADASASALLQELIDVQADLRRRQGEVTEEDIDRFRRLRRAVDADPTISAYVESQDAATAYLREVNQDLSQLLGLDFSALAKRGGCC